MSTEATLSRHLQAFNEGVDSIMRDYTDASVLFTPDGKILMQSFAVLAPTPAEVAE